MELRHRITPFLWFDDQAEEAANFYVSIFDDARITDISRYPDAGREVHGKPAGSVLTVSFELDGQPFIALNGGPAFTFDEAISFQIACASQEEADRYWDALTDGGVESNCGWLKDRFGLSWQVVPAEMFALLSDPDPGRAARATEAMLAMKRIDLAAIRRAADGDPT